MRKGKYYSGIPFRKRVPTVFFIREKNIIDSRDPAKLQMMSHSHLIELVECETRPQPFFPLEQYMSRVLMSVIWLKQSKLVLSIRLTNLYEFHRGSLQSDLSASTLDLSMLTWFFFLLTRNNFFYSFNSLLLKRVWIINTVELYHQ